MGGKAMAHLLTAKQMSRLCSDGRVSIGQDGRETLRVGLHWKAELHGSAKERRSRLDSWLDGLRPWLENVAGSLVENTLSITGQSVEAELPVEYLLEHGADSLPSGVELRIIEHFDARA
jgi:hypothetical protein